MPEATVSPRIYFLTYAALLCLTLGTVLIGYLDLGWFSMFVAVAIAAIKATLIAAFFMHALYEKVVIRLLIGGALLWFLILITLTMCDYITRSWLPVPGK
ncbi:MAG TPA: cytochrome C oxidase subunit IV family protein [Terriglobia bacterium]|nr:cytochrome C oxidase subunit IV family protein [Terriglobia bacterium]